MSTEGHSGARPGRIWIMLALTAAIVGLAIAITGIATREPSTEYQKVIGAGQTQQIYGGVRQLGDRLGNEDAPVQMQVFVDVQSSAYQQQFLDTIPPLVNSQVRGGQLQLLLRNRSLTRNATELAFYGVAAATEQNYGWQFADLMVRNQEAAVEKGRVDREFLRTLAEAIPHMDLLAWEESYDAGVKEGSEMTARLEAQDKLAIKLGIRAEPAVVVTGPRGTETVQDAPDLEQIEAAITAVR